MNRFAMFSSIGVAILALWLVSWFFGKSTQRTDLPDTNASAALEATATPASAADVERDQAMERQKKYIADLVHQSNEPNAAHIQRQTTVRGVSANALYRAYDSNELAADEQYRGKRLNITGTVYQMGRDISGSPFVVIGGSGMLDGVQCIFPDAASRQIALLKKGDKVVVIGKIAGKVATSVVVTDCAFQPH
jgi:hypothetical protein